MFEPRLPDYVDSSMLASFRSCEQKFYWGYVRRLASKTSSVDLHFGGCFASALESARRKFYSPQGGSIPHAREAAVETLIHEWSDFQAPEGHAKNLVSCWAALDQYFDEYPFNTDLVQPAMRHDGTPAVEFTFALPLPIKHPETDNPIFYCGRFDMLGEIAGECYVVDEKTTGRSWPANWVDQWKMRGQFIGYTWAAREAGYNCKGALVRSPLILKREIRMLATPPMFYPPWLIERWYAQTVRDVERLVNCWNTKWWNRDFGEACAMYSGCSHLALCTAQDPSLWFGDYEDRLWNPLSKNPLSEPRKDAA